MKYFLLLISFLCVSAFTHTVSPQSTSLRLNATAQQYSAEERPWIWWFWLGNIVSEKDIDHHLQTYAWAGYGGVNIIASYTVPGYEGREIVYRSPECYKMIRYTIRKAKSLNMGVDLALSSAWPFGGPQVKKEDGAQFIKTIQSFQTDSSIKQQLIEDGDKEYVIAVSAFSSQGKYKDLTQFVDNNGLLEAELPTGNWDIEAVIGGYTSQQVKRSSPGGEGLVTDHFDKEAMLNYLNDFNRDIQNIQGVRGLFNDSYEVYGADYTRTLITEFEKRRGYSPKPYLSLLKKNETNELTERFLSDYRATMADLILENFLRTWTTWTNHHHLQTIQQAHGSPSNLLDMYAAADIPQCESFGPSCFDIDKVRVDPDTKRDPYKWPDILHMKFSSSAGNLMGRKLVSSETATWLTNHFRTALSQVKPEVDKLFVAGINHIHLISSTNSPLDAPYPGWVFYPAPDFGPNSALLPYMPDFSLYTSRVQHILQQSTPDNDILIYYPVFDYFSEVKKDLGVLTMMDHIPTKWGSEWPFAITARKLKASGYQFDYVSDKILQDIRVENGRMISKGGTQYKAIVIPACNRIPVETMQKLIELAGDGIPVIFDTHIPENVPGLGKLDERMRILMTQREAIKSIGCVSVTQQLDSVLTCHDIPKNAFVTEGLEYIRKSWQAGKIYFIANQQSKFRQGFIELDRAYNNLTLYDPMTGETCSAITKQQNGKTYLYLQLLPGQSIVLFADCVIKSNGVYQTFPDAPVELKTKWDVEFAKNFSGQPTPMNMDEPRSWTESADSTHIYYHGTGTYTAYFDKPGQFTGKGKAQLILTDVRDMAEVILNGKSIGRVWSVPYQIDFDASLLKKRNNKIEIKVTNLATNRIISMDKHGEKWQECYIADPKRRSFHTADWEIVPSGLIGPVYLNQSKHIQP